MNLARQNWELYGDTAPPPNAPSKTEKPGMLDDIAVWITANPWTALIGGMITGAGIFWIGTEILGTTGKKTVRKTGLSGHGKKTRAKRKKAKTVKV